MLSLHDILHSQTVRMAAVVAGGMTVTILLLFTFIFWQTAITETHRVDHVLERDAQLLSTESTPALEQAVRDRVAADFHRVVIVALFDPAGRKEVGNLEKLPDDVPIDGQAHSLHQTRSEFASFNLERHRIVARRLPDGKVLAIGRNVDSLEDLRMIVVRALLLGVPPAVLLSLVVGAFFGYRAQRQMSAVHVAAERIMRGNLQERLPHIGNRNDVGRLVTSVNHMLDEIESAVEGLRHANQHIAHDLRTPLTRVRLRLEQSSHQANSSEELREVVDRSIEGLDQALRIITSLLRMGQMDSGRGRDEFADLDLRDVIQDVADLYEPVTAEKQIAFTVKTTDLPTIRGDRDLIMEAVVNLVDNAVKFTGTGGRVTLSTVIEQGRPIVRVADNGPGIAPEERQAVLQRFFRSERTKSVVGSGLGLSLVDSIARLHGFSIVIRDADPGCMIDLVCGSQDVAAGGD
jgi:hypothetical protein